MTFELAHRNLPYIDCPSWVALLAILTLWAEKILKLSAPWLARQEVWALVQFDRGRKVVKGEIETHHILFRLAYAFISFYIVWLLLSSLENILLWMR